jgi:protoheme IX farnesyltransferase
MATLTRRLQTARVSLYAKLRTYWALIKGLQTGLLLITGLAGYTSARSPETTWQTSLVLTGSLFLAISGCTMLNMVFDRDIDAKMKRTARRPLPSGQVDPNQALLVGVSLSWLGVGWAFTLGSLYGAVVLAMVFFDVVVYTIWLKRRTPWSVLWGGIAGGMPALAGRVLGVGQIDLIGLLLSLAVLLWIPTHVTTLGIKYADDYRRAGVPLFSNLHGERITRLIVGLSTGAAAISMLLAMWQVRLGWSYLWAAIGLGALLVGFAAASALHPSPKLNFALFKMASLYMLGSMGLIIIGV